MATGLSMLLMPWLFLPASTPARRSTPRPVPITRPPVRNSRPLTVQRLTLEGVSLYQTRIDLTDPKVFLTIGLPGNAPQANSSRVSYGSEAFEAMVGRHRSAVAANGTFFSMDQQQRVMGNLVSNGRFLKYSPWENYGTTLGLKTGNRPEMVTARVEGKPKWQQHWFSLTAGPRLLKRGKIQINPRQEGFTDPNVMGVAVRGAIGFSKNGQQLILATFLESISLEQEARLMQKLGAYEAMNLDGGTSLALAQGNRILLPTDRPLTNVLLVYDIKHPAPKAVQQSWNNFQQRQRVPLPAKIP